MSVLLLMVRLPGVIAVVRLTVVVPLAVSSNVVKSFWLKSSALFQFAVVVSQLPLTVPSQVTGLDGGGHP